jgi:prolyl-tRNA synthetase
MRTSQFYLNTLKEAPNDAELISHQLMVRAGLIKRLGSGLYTWMPLGLRVLRKVENIIREEMNRAHALELLMPAVQPADLWKESGRWQAFGPQMLKIKDRHEREFCFGPTHEEVITDIIRHEIKSYKQLPLNFYQIQTKFRDEIRPRFGVMRAREFMMKDAYSFAADVAGMQHTYETMYAAYTRIFTRLGLKFRAVKADTGAIGGSQSHEFHVLADSGEDALAFCRESDYAANVELAEALADTPRPHPLQALQEVTTPGKATCEEVAALLGVALHTTVKTLIVMGEDKLHLLLLRGDHQFNEVKANKLPGLATFRFATEAEIIATFGTKPGYLGPVAITKNVVVIADRSVAVMADFVCGANKEGYHLTGVNFGRDLPEPIVADIRNVVEGDQSPDRLGQLSLCRGIEVGHIFQLGNKYAEALQASFIDAQGKSQLFEMGCYGIGVSRIVAAAIEQNNDEKGIIFPAALAPFTVAIVPIGYHKSEQVKEHADKLYQTMQAAGIDVLLDDRHERPGVMFADIELIGIPHRFTLGERALANQEVEYKARTAAESVLIAVDGVLDYLQRALASSGEIQY